MLGEIYFKDHHDELQIHGHRVLPLTLFLAAIVGGLLVGIALSFWLFAPAPEMLSPVPSTLNYLKPPQVYAAESTPELPISTPEQIIEEEWGSDAKIGKDIAFCESSLNPGAKNKTSSATGLFQIIKATWIGNRKAMKLNTDIALRTDARENAKTAYFIYQHRGTQPWVSSKHCWENR